jgi:hypothetical protein
VEGGHAGKVEEAQEGLSWAEEEEGGIQEE